jgi:hypothetical protein
LNFVEIPEELVRRSATVHESIGNHSSRMTDGYADRVLCLLQDQQVTLVVADEELKVKFNAKFATKNSHQAVNSFLDHLFLLAKRNSRFDFDISLDFSFAFSSDSGS